jgi:hypothetical protein
VVEGARLESVYRGNSIEGSNPSLSATLQLTLKTAVARDNVAIVRPLDSLNKGANDLAFGAQSVVEFVLQIAIFGPGEISVRGFSAGWRACSYKRFAAVRVCRTSRVSLCQSNSRAGSGLGHPEETNQGCWIYHR